MLRNFLGNVKKLFRSTRAVKFLINENECTAKLKTFGEPEIERVLVKRTSHFLNKKPFHNKPGQRGKTFEKL